MLRSSKPIPGFEISVKGKRGWVFVFDDVLRWVVQAE
jgi:hypothetical protein